MKFRSLLLLLFVNLSLANSIGFAGDKPNVLLVLTDDQGFGDVASHGNEFISTPVHDRIAKEGARFDRFFVSPVCAPTRAAMLTGRYHPRTGVHGVTRGYETMRANEVTIAEILKAGGYATGAFGKWHNGAHFPQHPNGQGFDEFFGFCAGHWNLYFDTHLEHNGSKPTKTEGYIVDTVTNRAIDWIKKQQKRKKPWFAYLPYNTPHSPWQVPEKYWQKYQNKGLTPEAACAYGMVENIDDNMGRVLSLLEETKQLDNTIVVFLTDNGANSDRFNAGMRGRKGSPHEGGTRVPLFIRYPKLIEPGTVVKPITAHIDLLPTLVEMTGVKMLMTKPLDGKSLVPLIDKSIKNRQWPDRTLYTEYRQQNGRPGHGAVRTEKWRAVRSAKGKKKNKWMLFDMENDPGEKNDLAKTKPKVLKDLQQKFMVWFKDVTKEGFEPIPTEIGHKEHPTVHLPGHEAHLQIVSTDKPGISYKGRPGFANDYITNWTDTKAHATWPVKVVSAGRYEVSIDYALRKEDFGAILEIHLGEESVAGAIDIPYEPKDIPHPFRISRSNIVMERTWATREMGVMTLKPSDARQEVLIKTIATPGMRSAEIKNIRFKKIEDLPGISLLDTETDYNEILVRSSLDRTLQPSLLWVPESKPNTAQPLFVFLHSWSGDYTQNNSAWLKQAKANNWIFLHPNFRGRNRTPKACGSEFARQDILDAMQYVIENHNVDTSRVYLAGGSGGGHMALLMAGHHPDKFSAVSAWCPITDIAEWHRFSRGKNPDSRYANEIEASIGGVPGSSEAIQKENESRSSVYHLHNAIELPVDIAAGIHDGYTGSVPVSHSLRAFNVLLKAKQHKEITLDKIQHWIAEGAKPSSELNDLFYECNFERDIYFQKECGLSRVTLFDGGHEARPRAGVWFLNNIVRKTSWPSSNNKSPQYTKQNTETIKQIKTITPKRNETNAIPE